MTPFRSRRLNRRGVLAALGVAVATGHGAAAQSTLDDIIAGMTLRERVARMFVFPLSGPVLLVEEAAWLEELQPGGVILVQHNFGTAAEVQALTAAIRATASGVPPFVSLDQEGGIVTRLWDDPAPDAPTLATLSLEEISAFARMRADFLATYGFDLNFAPVADVAFSPDSFMAGRTLGDDPLLVSERVVAYLDGAKGSEVLPCVKHFPGHGRVSVDSHQALPVLEVDSETWRTADALPFAAAIADGVPMVMLGHLATPMWDGLPASLSPIAVQVLREDLAFDGVIVTDDLFMGALNSWLPLEIIDLAIAAGVDLLLYVDVPDTPASLVDHVVGRVTQGEISEERINESARRIIAAQLGVVS